jgi:O-methyltransferase domain
MLLCQPDVIARALPHDRIKRVAGNFFESVPTGADAYILRSLIHDWGDSESVAILKNVRAAAKSGSRVILIEQVIPETSEYASGKWEDLSMMSFTGGQERTVTEYRQLLETAGFDLEQTVPTSAGPSLIVSRPED